MITLYTKTVCRYCVQAKAYLDRNEIPYTAVNLEEDAVALNFIKFEKGHTSVPQLYVNGEILVEGGASELEKLHPDEVRERVATLSA